MTSSGSFFRTGFFKFVDDESGQTLLDFNDDKKKFVEGKFGDKNLAANGIETLKVRLIKMTIELIRYPKMSFCCFTI